MSIGKYLAALRRKLWVVALATVLGLLAGLGLAMTAQKTYQATAELYITVAPGTPAQDVSSSATFLQDQMVAYAALAKSPSVLDAAIRAASLPTTSSTLAQQVTATTPTGTTLMDITVTGPEPSQAMTAANAVADQLVQRVKELSPTASTSTRRTLQAYVSNPAELPPGPTGASRSTYLAAGLLLGLALGVLVAVLAELADTRVRSEQDLDELGVPVLGSIPRAGKRGSQIESLRRVRNNLDARPHADHPVHVVTSTTLRQVRTAFTRQLAEAGAMSGRRVLVIHADTPGARGELHGGLAAVLRGELPVRSAIHNSPVDHLDELPAGDVTELSDLLAGGRLHQVVEQVRGDYDLTLIDAPAILTHTDAAAIGRTTDGAVLLVPSWVNTSADVRHALNLLEAGAVTLSGVVLTQENERPAREARRAANERVPGAHRARAAGAA